ncbi:hypothetical protein F0562_017005 [Nyssa sinensis]|uniref:Uncharacterized protein n=1 Tax=Nyssa sinensis TaxID=561372 RepID=A0A5J4ZEQ5_9ASTE|nr:hypothetical protein F0562_017005 [Nyssa sinensis]
MFSNRRKPSLKDAIAASISKGKLVSGATNVDSELTSSVPTFANPFWIEVIVIAKRSLTNSMRAPELYGMRLGAVLVTWNHLSHYVLEARQFAQGRPRTSWVLRFRHVHNLLHLCRSHPSLSSRTLYLHERDRLQRISSIILRALSRHNLHPLSGIPLTHIRRHNLLGRRSRRESLRIPLLFLLHPGSILGRKLLRYIPFWSRISRYVGLHSRGCHFSLLPPLQRLLHHPRPNPSILDMVSLRLSGKIPISSFNAIEAQALGDDEQYFGTEHHKLHMRHHWVGYTEATRSC